MLGKGVTVHLINCDKCSEAKVAHVPAYIFLKSQQ